MIYHFHSDWTGTTLPIYISLADPGFGQPGRIDLLLRVDVFVDVPCHGRWSGSPDTPTALETEFGWVVCRSSGPTSTSSAHACVTTYHSTVTSGDNILRQFWEREELPVEHSTLSAEEWMVVQHFNSTH